LVQTQVPCPFFFRSRSRTRFSRSAIFLSLSHCSRSICSDQLVIRALHRAPVCIRAPCRSSRVSIRSRRSVRRVNPSCISWRRLSRTPEISRCRLSLTPEIKCASCSLSAFMLMSSYFDSNKNGRSSRICRRSLRLRLFTPLPYLPLARALRSGRRYRLCGLRLRSRPGRR